jgi:hypothetical protein
LRNGGDITRRAAWSQSLSKYSRLVQRQMLDQGLAPDPLAGLAGAPDRLMRLLAGHMHDIEGHARHVGDHDGAVRRLAFDLGRAGIGVPLGPVLPSAISLACRSATMSPFSAWTNAIAPSSAQRR